MGTQAEETYLTLRLFHPDLNPVQVASELGIKPSASHRKGDPRQAKSGKVYAPYHTGLWALSTRETVASADLRDHLDALFRQLAGKEEHFDRYHKNGFNMDIFVFWVTHGIGGGPMLTSQHAQQMSAFKLDLFFDLY